MNKNKNNADGTQLQGMFRRGRRGRGVAAIGVWMGLMPLASSVLRHSLPCCQHPSCSGSVGVLRAAPQPALLSTPELLAIRWPRARDDVHK